ncbi:trypsin-like serine peptidase [Devosia lacusdianchii]|uniref:trypsin-like serine peptidase n=1 Tax=Devosia lacusdianchii TaxID=2917991 RepID=UPI001F065474|nr:hypothetical protein [Devosia sp. JXJ CY 41]
MRWRVALVLACLAAAPPVAMAEDAEAQTYLLPAGCILSGTCFSQPSSWRGASAFSGAELEADALDEVVLQPQSIVRMPAVPQALMTSVLEELSRPYVPAETSPEDAFSELQKAELAAFPDYEPPPLPEALWAEIEAYMASERYTLCDAAVARLGALEGSSETISEDELAYMGAVYTVYLDNCLGKASIVDAGISDRLVLLTSSFRTGIPAVYCAGFNIAGPYVLTAKHCLVERQTLEDFAQDYGAGNTTERITNVNVLPESVALVAGIAPHRFAFDIAPADEVEQDLAFNPNLPLTDLVILKLQDFPAGPEPFATAPTSYGDRLAIYGGFFSAAGIKDMPNDALALDLRSSLRVDTAPTCRVYFVGNGCIHHGCQTFAGFSGSPIFVEKGAGWALAGVHAGSAAPEANLCAYPRTTFFPNYGVDLSAAGAMPEIR